MKTTKRGRDIGFRRYLALGVINHMFDPAESDFAGDALRDPNFADFGSWRELELYLVRKDACIEAINAAKVLWRKWVLGR